MYPVQPFWVKGPIIRKGEVTLSGSVRLSVAFAIPCTHPIVNWASYVEAHTSQSDHCVEVLLGKMEIEVEEMISSCKTVL